jgi:hypothetical protein
MTRGKYVAYVTASAVMLIGMEVAVVWRSQRDPVQPALATGPAAPRVSNAVRIGHVGGPLLGPLHGALDGPAQGPLEIEARKFSTGGDVGYALLSGELDAGLIEPSKAIREHFLMLYKYDLENETDYVV